MSFENNNDEVERVDADIPINEGENKSENQNFYNPNGGQFGRNLYVDEQVIVPQFNYVYYNSNVPDVSGDAPGNDEFNYYVRYPNLGLSRYRSSNINIGLLPNNDILLSIARHRYRRRFNNNNNFGSNFTRLRFSPGYQNFARPNQLNNRPYFPPNNIENLNPNVNVNVNENVNGGNNLGLNLGLGEGLGLQPGFQF